MDKASIELDDSSVFGGRGRPKKAHARMRRGERQVR
jgi:hypothetical protein